MGLRQRLGRLERELTRNRICRVCGGCRQMKLIEVYEGEKDPPLPGPCPGCGLDPMVMRVQLFGKRPEADKTGSGKSVSPHRSK